MHFTAQIDQCALLFPGTDLLKIMQLICGLMCVAHVRCTKLEENDRRFARRLRGGSAVFADG